MKKLNKAEQRTKHIEHLSAIFGLEYSQMKVVFKDLKTIEMQGHKLAEDYCNGVVDSDEYDNKVTVLKSKLNSLLPESDAKKNVMFNGDPRGHFLKINDEHVRQAKLVIDTDWGGYGIICPEGV